MEIRPPWHVKLDKIGSAAMAGLLGTALLVGPLWPELWFVGWPPLLASALLGLCLLLATAFLARSSAPFRVIVTTGEVRFMGLLGFGPDLIPLGAIRQQSATADFRLPYTSLAMGHTRYAPATGTRLYSAGLTTALRDSLRQYCGVRLDMHSGGVVFIETSERQRLSDALTRAGVPRVP